MSNGFKVRNTIEMEKSEFITWVIDRIAIGLRKPVDDGKISRPCTMFPGLEEYLTVIEFKDGQPRGKGELIRYSFEKADINIGALWKIAEWNTAKSAEVTPILDAMLDMASELELPKSELEDLLFEGEDLSPMVIVSNKNRHYGAGAALYCHDQMKNYAVKTGFHKWLAFPASEHEFIFVAYYYLDDKKDPVDIMRETDQETGRDDHLIDKVFYMEF